MRCAFPAAGYPARPYPGARPGHSFVQVDATGHPLRAEGTDWLVEPHDQVLDDWLAVRGEQGLEARIPVLAYGSNACPAKITWLAAELGLPGPVVVLRVVCRGLSAVWAAGFRVVDEQRPATLAGLAGATEVHALWLATQAQIEVLDVCEGRGVRYDLARLHTGTVTLESGTVVGTPLAYVGRAAARMPLLVDGVPVRCVDVDQARAGPLRGVPAASDGLHREVVAPADP